MFRGKKLRTLRLAALGLAGWALFTSAAQADIDIANAKIVRLGPDPRLAPNSNMVQVIDQSGGPQFTGIRQYYLSAALGNAGLATMLTALSLGQTVWIRVAGNGADGSLITIIFLNAPGT